MNDSFYYLTCMYEERMDQKRTNNSQMTPDLNQSLRKPLYLSFKILIKLTNETLSHKPEKTKPLVDQVTVINQLKINTYYSFSQSSFQQKEALIDSLISQFNQQINALVKSVYLTLTLREIHETRKWNNLLVLKEDILGLNHNESKVNAKQSSKRYIIPAKSLLYYYYISITFFQNYYTTEARLILFLLFYIN